MVSIAVLLAVVSFSYAYIKYDTEEQGVNVLGTDCISISMQDVTSSITLQKAFPMTEENGEKTDPYTFTLTNNCSIGVNYQINLRVEDEEIQEDKKMPVEDNIATKIDGNDKVILSSTNKIQKEETETEEESKDEYKISTEDFTLAPHATVEHSVRIWLNETAGNETQNKIFKSKVVVEAIQNQIVESYKDQLNGAEPVLSGDLVAVIIDSTTGEVTKANTEQEWYNYGEKEWANAIIPTEDAKNDVQSLNAGEKITEDQIESYFVWIPKYKYKLFNEKLGNYTQKTGKENKNNQAIEIIFGTDNTTDNEEGHECKTPEASVASGSNGNCNVGDYMTHPAFLAFGNVKGLWVGKFESGHSSGSVIYNIKEYNDSLQDELIIKPNAYSWRSTNVSTMYQIAKNYQDSLYSHMMKNTEWGAVAYLTQSVYGRCTKSGEQSICEEVTINNNSNYITGYAGASVSEVEVRADPQRDAEDTSTEGTPKSTYNYNNPKSAKASTTGNYTGIYDMSGGAYDRVMTVMFNQEGKPSYSDSGFTDEIFNKIESKYYDAYKYSTDTNSNDYTKRILGDATGEMGPFDTTLGGQSSYYDDDAHLPYFNYPWIERGGYYGYKSRSGIFFFDRDHGGAISSMDTFRVVLAPL